MSENFTDRLCFGVDLQMKLHRKCRDAGQMCVGGGRGFTQTKNTARLLLVSCIFRLVIRLEFYILLHFEEKSSILRRLLKICKALYISKICSYIY